MTQVTTRLGVLAVCALAGCGGSSEQTFTRESVQETMSQAIRDQLPANTTMDPLECVEDGDTRHWKCISYALQGNEQRFTLTVAITCDAETGQCISEPVSFALRP